MKTDPMKEINKKIYLNPVSLKTRYQLLNLNQQNEKLGYEIGKQVLKKLQNPTKPEIEVQSSLGDF